MAYDKHTWISGETITATELNDMESGIENNSERLDELTATVNKNTTDIDGKLDKSSVTTSLTSTSDTDALAASAGKTLNDALTNTNIVSINRVALNGVTTGSSGNIALGVANDGKTAIFGALVNAKDYYVRIWVASSNNTFYATVINPNTGATINSESVDLRYWLVKTIKL